jgi:hypothetical protein
MDYTTTRPSGSGPTHQSNARDSESALDSSDEAWAGYDARFYVSLFSASQLIELGTEAIQRKPLNRPQAGSKSSFFCGKCRYSEFALNTGCSYGWQSVPTHSSVCCVSAVFSRRKCFDSKTNTATQQAGELVSASESTGRIGRPDYYATGVDSE